MIINDVCVLGGSGFVGRHVCHQLAARGYRVTVPDARPRARQSRSDHAADGRRCHRGRARSRDAAPASCAAATRSINLVGVLHDGRGKASFQQAHVELARKVVDACRRNGVRRLLHMSALNAGVSAPSAYLRSKGEAEDDRARVRASISRSSGRRSSSGARTAFSISSRRLLRVMPVIVLGSPNARFQPVYVEDVARAFAESLTRLESFGRTLRSRRARRSTRCASSSNTSASSPGTAGRSSGLGDGLSDCRRRVMEPLAGEAAHARQLPLDEGRQRLATGVSVRHCADAARSGRADVARATARRAPATTFRDRYARAS